MPISSISSISGPRFASAAGTVTDPVQVVVDNRIRADEQRMQAQRSGHEALAERAKSLLLQGITWATNQQTAYQNQKEHLSRQAQATKKWSLKGLAARVKQALLVPPQTEKIPFAVLDPNPRKNTYQTMHADLIYEPPKELIEPFRLLEESGLVQIHTIREALGFGTSAIIPTYFSLTDKGQEYVRKLQSNVTA